MRTLKTFYITISFLSSYLLGSFLWSILIHNKLYHTTDSLIFFIDFLPFVGRKGFVEKQYGENYALGVSPIMLYAIWLLFVIGILLLPLFIYRLFDKLKK